MNEKFMTRRGVLRGIGAAGISTAFVTSLGSASGNGDEYVSKKAAREYAKNAVEIISTYEGFDDWQPQAVKLSQLYHTKIKNKSSEK